MIRIRSGGAVNQALLFQTRSPLREDNCDDHHMPQSVKAHHASGDAAQVYAQNTADTISAGQGERAHWAASPVLCVTPSTLLLSYFYLLLSASVCVSVVLVYGCRARADESAAAVAGTGASPPLERLVSLLQSSLPFLPCILLSHRIISCRCSQVTRPSMSWCHQKRPPKDPGPQASR